MTDIIIEVYDVCVCVCVCVCVRARARKYKIQIQNNKFHITISFRPPG